MVQKKQSALDRLVTQSIRFVVLKDWEDDAKKSQLKVIEQDYILMGGTQAGFRVRALTCGINEEWLW